MASFFYCYTSSSTWAPWPGPGPLGLNLDLDLLPLVPNAPFPALLLSPPVSLFPLQLYIHSFRPQVTLAVVLVTGHHSFFFSPFPSRFLGKKKKRGGVGGRGL